jgi:hypothetical protein
MKRKKSLIVFSTALLLVLLAVSTTSTSAALTNNWGVDEGTTLNYTIEESFGDHKESYDLEVTIVTVADVGIPVDDLADLFYTYESRSEDGIVTDADNGKVLGSDTYNYNDILSPLLYLEIPVLPVADDGGAGLNWDQKTTIETALSTWDEVTVTESADTFKVVGEFTLDHPAWGNQVFSKEVEWDKSEGVLKYYLEESEYTEADITEKIEVSEGELSEGFLEGNAPVIAAAALGLAFLAFLMVLVKK